MRRRPGALIAEIAARDPAVADLARVVSPAVQIEPQLLRRARLELVPGATAATEADLWFSRLVARSSPAGIVLDADVCRELRRELAGRTALLGRACRVIAEVHAGEVPVIRAEERLVALGLLAEAREQAGAAAQLTVLGLGHGAEAGALIEEELRALAAAMRRATGPGFARWVARALPALPPAAGTSATAWALALGASMRLGGRRILPGVPPDEVTPGAVAWLLPEDGPRTEVGVRLLVGALEFSTAEIPPDAQLIRPPRTDPVILGVSYLDGAEIRSRRVVLPASGTATVPVMSEGLVAITTALGHRYTIEPERSVQRMPEILVIGTEQDRRLQGLVMNGARDAGVDAIDHGSEFTAEGLPTAIYTALARCDGAAVLLTREALTSAWVQREVTILMWRRSIGADLFILPVVARDVVFSDVVDSPLAETGLLEIQFIVESEPQQTMAQVTEALRRFAAEWRQPASRAATASASAWRARLDCPEAVTAGEDITAVVGATLEHREDLPVLAAFPEGAQIEVSATVDGRTVAMKRVPSLAALADNPVRGSFRALPGRQTVAVQATFSLGGTPLVTVDRRIRVVNTASADRPAVYQDETGERQLLVLDRLALRQAIRRLLDPRGELRILVVTGPHGSGKSFTYRMIQQAAEQIRVFQIVNVDLERLELTTPADLSRELVLHMGGSVGAVPRESTTASRHARELADWLMAQLPATNRNWCWILHGLSSPSVSPAMHDLIWAIVNKVPDAPLRLALLGFDGALPPGIEPFTYREELTPIGEPEVREFFADLQGHVPDPLGIDVEALTQAALDGLPAGRGRLGALSARLSEFADLLTNAR